ncbi:oleate delta-12 desaturase [Aspergillus aurantiobrunneus]
MARAQRKEATEPPTLEELKNAIPNECFQSSLVTSMGYLVRDVFYALGLVYAALQIKAIPSTLAQVLLWAFYGFLQGLTGTGLWIVGHECGHGSFSSYPWINDFIGWSLHSMLLTPYFSWKITHARHHRYTSHIDKDVAFSPNTDTANNGKSRIHDLGHLTDDTLTVSLVKFLAHQGFAWPLYLLLNVSAGSRSGPRNLPVRNSSHLNPFNNLWIHSQRFDILLSNFGLSLMVILLYSIGTRIGAREIVLLYFIPYLWVNNWIVAITYLQHTHPLMPHYGDAQWTYMRGALATADRTVGFVGRHFFHDLVDFHAIHHIFPKIPLYKCEEATSVVRPLLGDYYHEYKHENFFGALWKTFRQCVYVSERSVQGSTPGIFYWDLSGTGHKRDSNSDQTIK